MVVFKNKQTNKQLYHICMAQATGLFTAQFTGGIPGRSPVSQRNTAGKEWGRGRQTGRWEKKRREVEREIKIQSGVREKDKFHLRK